MKTRVLIVDDSIFIRCRLAEILDADSHIEVIGSASNGMEAIRLVSRLKPDVVTMDIEMPIMDGITAVREIMKICPTPILMFSSLTTTGAKATLDALEAGAVDFIPKSLSDISSDREIAKRQLCARVRVINNKKLIDKSYNKQNISVTKTRGSEISNLKGVSNFDLIMIGTSTGGPAAIQKILSGIPDSFEVPIIIVQHMPESFTGPFSTRLNSLCKAEVLLASNGDLLKKGCIYIAPGGHQLSLTTKRTGEFMLVVERSTNEHIYKPCIDITFESVSKNFKGKILAIILTGMGSDGLEGVKELKKTGAKILVQDKDSSIVYGMPMTIVKEGLEDVQLSLSKIAEYISG